MDSKPVFDNFGMKTHMPFCDGQHLVFTATEKIHAQEFECGGAIWDVLRANPALQARFADLPQRTTSRYRPWKCHYRRWLEADASPQRLETGLPDSAVECSPAFYCDNSGQWHVSFIGGIPDRYGFNYHLYQMSGPSFDRLGPAAIALDIPTKTGFISERYVCFTKGAEIVLRHRDSNEESVLTFSFAPILRVSFCADNLDRLLITGAKGREGTETALYDLSSGELFELRTPEGAYKPTLFSSHLLYVHKQDCGLEECKIRQGNYEMVQASVRVRKKLVAA